MPSEGYKSVNLPVGLHKAVKTLVEDRPELGYRSVAEFVSEAVRIRVLNLK